MSKSNEPPKHLSELHRLVNIGCDQLDREMRALGAENASLITQWLMWEMATNEKSFEEVSVDLCRSFIRTHMTALQANAGSEVQKYLNENAS